MSLRLDKFKKQQKLLPQRQHKRMNSLLKLTASVLRDTQLRLVSSLQLLVTQVQQLLMTQILTTSKRSSSRPLLRTISKQTQHSKPIPKLIPHSLNSALIQMQASSFTSPCPLKRVTSLRFQTVIYQAQVQKWPFQELKRLQVLLYYQAIEIEVHPFSTKRQRAVTTQQISNLNVSLMLENWRHPKNSLSSMATKCTRRLHPQLLTLSIRVKLLHVDE